jgi:prefoldin subunit 5
MSESNPLAGLTQDQADEAIERLQAKIAEREDSLKVAKAHLRDLKAARKDLVPPQPPGDGTRAQAQTAEVTAEGVDA